jgi:hypothetical protein
MRCLGQFMLISSLLQMAVIAGPPDPASTERTESGMSAALPAGPTLPGTASGSSASEAKQKLPIVFSAIPLHFEANRGQFDAQVKFASRGLGHTIFLTPNEAVLVLTGQDAGREGSLRPARRGREERRTTSAMARMKLVGSNPSPVLTGLDELPGRSNYLRGNDPTAWRTNIPHFARVQYREVYPGVDLVYYGNEGQLEYDFVVAPGVDPAEITMAIDVASDVREESLRRDGSGDLLLTTGSGHLRFRRPLVYQEVDGLKQIIPADYVIKAPGRVSFEIGPYNRALTLIIDPVLSFSTYLGGTSSDLANSVAADSSGIYIAGFTASSNFPTTAGAFMEGPAIGGAGCVGVGCEDAFVTKLAANGSGLVYSTYLGGMDADRAYGIALDAAGNAYVTGFTSSTDFPVTATTAFQTVFDPGTTCTRRDSGPAPAPCDDAFVTVLNSDGTDLIYSTYLGSADEDYGKAVAVDGDGNVYVTGYTNSTSFPVTTSTPGGGTCQGETATYPCGDAFVAKFNPAAQSGADSRVYSRYLGGNGDDEGFGIAVDPQGNAYVAGATVSGLAANSFPTPGGAQPAYGGGFSDAFLAKINSAGTQISYGTFLGGSDEDYGSGVKVWTDSGTTYAFVAGYTISTNFPTTVGAFQTSSQGFFDAFVAKLDPSLAGSSSRIYSTRLGGSSGDGAFAITVDASGAAHVAGLTFSNDFPLHSPVQTSRGGDFDAFVTKVNSSGTGVSFSTFLGGTLFDAANGVALDSTAAVVAGETQSSNFMTASPYDATLGGTVDGFVAKIDIEPSFSLTRGSTSSTVNAGASAPFTLTITPDAGFSQPVTLACSVTPVVSLGPTCSFSTNPVDSSAGPAQSTLTVRTTGPASATTIYLPEAPIPPGTAGFRLLWLFILFTSSLLAAVVAFKHHRRLVLASAILTVAFALASCGGGGGGGGTPPPTSRTPAGTYTVGITATAGSLNYQTRVTVTVN